MSPAEFNAGSLVLLFGIVGDSLLVLVDKKGGLSNDEFSLKN